MTPGDIKGVDRLELLLWTHDDQRESDFKAVVELPSALPLQGPEITEVRSLRPYSMRIEIIFSQCRSSRSAVAERVVRSSSPRLRLRST